MKSICEGAPGVTEEFALQRVLRQGRAIDRDKGRIGLWLAVWIFWAKSSLPVPLSPRIQTMVSVVAIFSANEMAVWMDGCFPEISLKLTWLGSDKDLASFWMTRISLEIRTALIICPKESRMGRPPPRGCT